MENGRWGRGEDFFTSNYSLLTTHGISRIDPHATLWHYMKMEILYPTLEKGGQGGFEMDDQPIESLSISLYPKGEVR